MLIWDCYWLSKSCRTLTDGGLNDLGEKLKGLTSLKSIWINFRGYVIFFIFFFYMSKFAKVFVFLKQDTSLCKCAHIAGKKNIKKFVIDLWIDVATLQIKPFPNETVTEPIIHLHKYIIFVSSWICLFIPYLPYIPFL